MTKAQTPNSVRVIEVIEVKSSRGAGTDEDNVRVVTQLWSFAGKLLSDDDPNKDANHIFCE